MSNTAPRERRPAADATSHRFHPRQKVGVVLMLIPVVVLISTLLLHRAPALRLLLILPSVLSAPAFVIGVALFFMGLRDRRAAVDEERSSDTTKHTVGAVLLLLGALCCIFTAVVVVTANVNDSNQWDELGAAAVTVVIGFPGAVMTAVGFALRRSKTN